MALTRRGLLLGWLLLASIFALHCAGLAADDVYITYRYADNFSLGRGLVFNPGERVFGETEPGLAILLGALHALLRLPIPVLGALVSLSSLVGISWLLFIEENQPLRRVAAAVAGTLVITCGYLWDAQGAAAPLVALLLLAAARIAEKLPALAGLLCGAAVWCRPDALVGAGLLGILLWREQRRFPWRMTAVAAALVSAGALAALAYYGAVIPNTLHAKQLHAARHPAVWIGFDVFWRQALRWFSPYWGTAAAWLLSIGVVGLPVFWRGAGRGGRLLVLNGLALALAYPLLRVPFFPWYAIATLLPLIYGLSSAMGRLLAMRPALGVRLGRTLAVVAALVSVAALFSVAAATAAWWRDGRANNWRLRAYGDAGRWLSLHSDPGEAVAFHEVGILAFFADRRVEDLLGLVTPRSLPYAREGDTEGAFLAEPPAFMIHHSFEGRGAIDPIVRREWFRAAYSEVARFDYTDGHFLAVYRRREDAALPPLRPPRARSLPPDPFSLAK